MPVDRGSIDAMLREIGEGERWWEQREFRDLPHILHADERMLGLVNGKLLGPRRPRLKPGGTWLVVVTNQRVICLKQERFARKQVEIPAAQILRIQQSSRFRSYQIAIETPLQKYRVRISKPDAFRFAGSLAPLMPSSPVRTLSPELEAWAWLPGLTTVAALPGVAGIVSSVSRLSPPDDPSRARVERLEAAVESLSGDVERLQQQVAFLEELLQQSTSGTSLPRAPLHS